MEEFQAIQQQLGGGSTASTSTTIRSWPDDKTVALRQQQATSSMSVNDYTATWCDYCAKD